MTEYDITVNRPTAKEYIEVAGLGLFKNGETTRLTDEQVARWFEGTGNPLSNFPEGITVQEVKGKPSGDKLAEQKKDEEKPSGAAEGEPGEKGETR